jgi:hypothetical protein
LGPDLSYSNIEQYRLITWPQTPEAHPHVATGTTFVFEVIATQKTRDTACHRKSSRMNTHAASKIPVLVLCTSVQLMLLPCIYTLTHNNLHGLSHRRHLKLYGIFGVAFANQWSSCYLNLYSDHQ